MSDNPLESKIDTLILKIDSLENEVSALKKEVDQLKNAGTKSVSVVSPTVSTQQKPTVHKPVKVAYENRVPALAKKAQETPVITEPASEAASAEIPLEVAVNSTPIAPSPVVKEKTSMENKIGKNVMSVVAAILVFASLIVFGGIIYAIIPDILKVVIMYGLSLAFAIVGISNMKKEGKYKVLFSSIAGTGVSALYISTLIAYFKFEILPAPVLIGIIVVWLAGTLFLSKSKSKMFMYICNVGLIISTFLVAADFEAYYFATILYILGLAFIYLFNRSDNFNKDCHVFMQLSVVSMFLAEANSESFVYQIILFVIVTAIVFAREYLYEINGKNIVTYMVASALWLCYIILFADKCNDQYYIGEYSVFVFIAALSALAAVFFIKHKDISKVLNYFVYYIWAASFILSNVGIFEEYLSFSLIAAAFLISGCAMKKLHLQIPGYIYLFIFLCVSPKAWNDSVVCIVVMAASIALYIYCVKNYHIAYKFLNTALFIFAFIMFSIEADFGVMPTFVVLAALSLFMNSKLYSNNYETGILETGSVIVGYVMNSIMMLVGLYFLKELDEPFIILGRGVGTFEFNLALIFIITVGLFSINTKRLFTVNLLPKEFCAVYIGVKFTILIIDMLARLEALSFVVSLILLVFAVVCIVLGFRFRYKSIRIYGLGLTLVIVFKLILFDIEYDSFLLRPLGLLGAGLLCFGISYLYSRLEKQNKVEIEKVE